MPGSRGDDGIEISSREVFGTYSNTLAGGRECAHLREFLGGPVLWVRDWSEAMRLGVSTLVHWRPAQSEELSAGPESGSVAHLYLSDGCVRSIGFPSVDPFTLSVRVADRPEDSIEHRLENSFFVPSVSDIDVAADFLNMVQSFHFSKFNAFSMPRPGWASPARGRDRILVALDRHSSREDEADLRLISAARDEFPNGQLLVRPHPEDDGPSKELHSQSVHEFGAEWLDPKWNPVGVLKEVDCVFVGASLLGLEAMLLGRTVYCCQPSFYSGWGHSVDRHHSSKRSIGRSLLEIAFAAYIDRVRYVDLTSLCPASPIDALWSLAKIRYGDQHSVLLSKENPGRERNLLALRGMGGEVPFSAEEIETDLAEDPSVLIDPCFLKLVKGHSVALVGPAGSLSGSGMGAEIDSHDIVVRMNASAREQPISADLARDIGSKLNVLYLGTSSVQDQTIVEAADSLTDLSEIVIVDVFPDGSATSIPSDVAFGHICSGDTWNRARIRIARNLARRLTRWLGGYIPRTGIAAVLDLLVHQPSRLLVTGFTFYRGGGHMARATVGDLTTTTDHDGRIEQHNSERELRVFSALQRRWPEVLVFDEVLGELLECSRRQGDVK